MPHVQYTRICPHCDRSFTTGHPRQVFCSNRCSAQARVHAVLPLADRLAARTNYHGGHWWDGTEGWLFVGHTHKGYGRIGIGRKGEGITSAHRAAWEVAYGPIPDGLWVLHRCDVRNCIRPEHLFLGSSQDNIADMVQKERNQRGERHYQSRLTADAVIEIRAAYAAGTSAVDLGERYGMSRQAITEVVMRRTWKHVA